jgi:hypothetical protein
MPSSPILLAAVLAAIAAVLPSALPRRFAGSGALLVALAASSIAVPLGAVPLLEVRARAAAAGIAPEAIILAGVLAAIGVFLVVAGIFESVRGRPVMPPDSITPASPRPLLLAVAALLAPSLWSITAVLAAAALFASDWPRRLRTLAPVLPLAVLAGFSATVGGVWDASLTRIRDVPFSTAAQIGGAIPLLLAVTGWTAAAPWHGLLGFVGPLLLVRVGAPAFDAGLVQWAPILWPILLGLLGWAAWRRDGRLAVQAGIVAGAVAAPAAWGIWIVGGSVLVAVGPAIPVGAMGAALGRAAGAVLLVVLAPVAMRVQLVWTLALAIAGFVVLLRCTSERAGAPSSAMR